MNEETSLARQLRKLAAPQTNLLLLGKIRPSLLFDPKEASSLDRDTVFAYGCTGLDKLVLINQSFEKFEKILFSESSKNFERSVQSKAVNEQLDEKINEFLTILSPYVLLRGAHEALEWLIYRFHIHMFNVDALIGCVLPYYYTRIFVRVIQLLDLSDEAGRWHWLAPIQKSGRSLELSVLLRHFDSDLGFRKFVCDLAITAGKLSSFQPNFNKNHNHMVISFSVITTYYALKQKKDVNDSYVIFFFPYIISGLKSGIASYCAGAYLILAILVTKVKFTPEVLEEFVIKICTTVDDNLTNQALELIMLIFQEQSNINMPKKVFSLLSSNSNLATPLFQLSSNCSNAKFIMHLIKKGIPASYKHQITNKVKNKDKKNKNAKLSFVVNLLEHASLNKKNVHLCFSHILKWYIKLCKKHKKKMINSLMQCGKALLKCLEVRWPDLFGCCVELYFKVKRDQVEKRYAWRLLKVSTNSLKHQALVDSGLTLFLAINHSNKAIRYHGVKTLVEQVKAVKTKNFEEWTDADLNFIKASLLDRISDDDPNIALKVLSLGEILADIIPQNELFFTLCGVLKKNVKEKSSKLRQLHREVLKVLCARPHQEETGIFSSQLLEAIIPFFMPLFVEDIGCSSLVSNTPLILHHPILKAIVEDSLLIIQQAKQDSSSLTTLIASVLMSIKKALQFVSHDSMTALITSFLTNTDFHNANATALLFILFLIQSAYALESNDSKGKLNLLSGVLHYVEILLSTGRVLLNEYSHEIPLDSVLEICMKHLRKQQLPLSAICFVLHLIIKETSILKEKEKQWWPVMHKNELNSNDQSFQILRELFLFLVKHTNAPLYATSFKFLLGVFFQHVLSNVQLKYWFLSYFWCCSICHLQVASLRMASTFCARNKGILDWFFCDSSIEFPSLLVAMFSEDELIRSAALDFLSENLLPCCPESSFPLKTLAEFISSHKEEIKYDHQQLMHIIDIWLSPAYQTVFTSNDAKPLENTAQGQVFNVLLNLTCDTSTPYIITNVLLQVLHRANSPDILSKFLPLVKYYFNIYKTSKTPLCATQLHVIQLLVQKFSCLNTIKLTENSDEYKTFMMLLKSNVMYGETRDTCVQEMTLKILGKEFFISIPSLIIQRNLLDTLVEMYVKSESTVVNAVIGKTLRRVCFCAYLLLKELPGNVNVIPNNMSLKEVKKSRMQGKDSFSAEVLEKGPWKKITVVLEIIQSKKRLSQKELLIPELFRILNLTLDWESQPSVEYLRQLILASIYNCCSQLGMGGLEETKFQVELIIQAIRSSNNPKTHHHALLVLNLAAMMFPDHVLKNIMSIFTFMGSSLVRQDDSYSFQVISQTIETVVPALQQASSQTMDTDTIQVMAEIIRMFVNSIPDIPHHRQLPLFVKLINTLGPSHYLWLPLAQVCERYAYPSSFYDIYTNKTKDKEISPTLEFSISLHEQFPLSIQLDTCLNLVTHLAALPVFIQESTSSVKPDKPVEPFDITTHTNKQLQDYKRNILCYMNQWISSPNFISQVCESEEQKICNLEIQYKALLEEALNYLELITNQTPTNAMQTNIHNQSHMPLLYDLLQNINSLLPCRLFIKVMKKLLNSPVLTIRRQAVEILNSKLEYQQKCFSQEDYNRLLKLLKPLLQVFDENTLLENESYDSKANEELHKQTTLFSMHLLCKVIGDKYPLKFYKVLPVVIKILCHCKSQPKLLVNTLLCLAELCKCLNALVLPHLNSFMPEIISLMEDSAQLFGNEYLALGLISALQGIIENLGAFLSSYMDSILTNVCALSARYEASTMKVLHEKLVSLCKIISTEVTPRVLFPSIQQSYENLLQRNISAVGPLVVILSDRISSSDPTEVVDYFASLQNFYLQLLNFRSEVVKESADVETVEGKIIDSVIAVVMKLSEPTFQAFFSEIYRWAVPSSVDKDTEEKKDRVLTFYKLTCVLAKNLKTLFVLFAKKFMRHCASVLESNNSTKSSAPYFGIGINSVKHSIELLNSIMDTLNFCFMYDDGHLAEKECFDVLMQPLVDQIENLADNEGAFQDHIDNHLSSCLAHFISAFSDSKLWKLLNYQVLLKTRHSSPKVRFAALQVIREVVRKMSDNYLVLLPESIPFLAEIMEDESFEVEQECQDVIIEMEKILGEPIKKYF